MSSGRKYSLQPCEKCPRRHRGGRRVTDRLREEDAEHRVTRHMRQDQDQRNQKDQLPQAREEQADLRLPERDKGLLARALEPEAEDRGADGNESGEH